MGTKTTATTTTVETTTSTTTTTTTTASTTTTSEGSGDASGESSGKTDPLELLEIFVDFDDGSGIVLEKTYKFIDVASLQPKSFVVCVGECEKEGFWMMIGFVSLSCLCLILSGISCLCSRSGRYATAAAMSVLSLGFIGGLIYAGVAGKVAWNFTGGYLGGTVLVLVIVIVLGCLPVKTKKVKQDDIEMYWKSLSEREKQSKKHADYDF